MTQDNLWTGSNGDENANRTFGNEEQPADVTAFIEEQRAQIAQLMPSLDYVLEAIEQEKALVADMRTYLTTLGSSPKKDDIQAEFRARELYISYLDRLESDLRDKLLQVTELTQ